VKAHNVLSCFLLEELLFLSRSGSISRMINSPFSLVQKQLQSLRLHSSTGAKMFWYATPQSSVMIAMSGLANQRSTLSHPAWLIPNLLPIINFCSWGISKNSKSGNSDYELLKFPCVFVELGTARHYCFYQSLVCGLHAKPVIAITLGCIFIQIIFS